MRIRQGLRTRILAVAIAAFPIQAIAGLADEFFTLKGHGGPVMDIAVSPDTGLVATASFDNSVGLWDGRTPRWLEGHEAAVNAVRFVGTTGLVSAGDDFSVRLWNLEGEDARILGRHKGKVMSLAVSPDHSLVASASWDGTIGLWPLGGGEGIFLAGHAAGVNDVVFSADGGLLYSASTDGTIRSWDIATLQQKRLVLRHGFGVNKLALNAEQNWLAYGTVDGITRVIDLATDARISDFTLERRPILSIALDERAGKLAVGDGDGFIMVVDTSTWKIIHDFRAALRGPIWALAFSRDGTNVDAGGIESIVYSWPLADVAEFGPMADSKPKFLKDPAKMENGERQFARKCSICHSLSPDGGRKAGPTLHAVFGRRAGTLAGYRYSATLAGSDIIWNEATIEELFELGPDHYIPGSKMPMQRITAQKDRDDLVNYLRRATAPGEKLE